MATPADRVVAQFASLLQEALNVLGTAKVQVSGPDDEGLYSLITNRDRGVVWHGRALKMRMRVRVVEELGELRLETHSYMHTYETTDTRGSRREQLAYHANPDQRPHVHIEADKRHVATGRVSIEDVIRTCIEDGWEPRYSDWDDRLLATHAHFMLNARWR